MIDNVNNQFNDIYINIYKQHILRNIAYYRSIAASLPQDYQYAINYVDLDPRILIILDDCSADLKPFWKKEVFKRIFYMGRHVNISIVICCQDDTDLPASLRKNVSVSIFTRDTVAKAYFEKAANGYAKATQKLVNEIAKDVFVDNRKLVYLESDPNKKYFYAFTAIQHSPFKYGSKVLDELCERVRNNGSNIDKSNPFYKRFKIG
jgi:hypothetical protein